MPDGHRALLKSHCYKCHNSEEQNGQVRLDNLPFTIDKIETAERWQKILNVLNSGAMPPEEEEPLPAQAKTDFLDELANVMVDVRKHLGDQGGAITMRRLNRREYRNTLRDLLGVKINVGELPSDSGTGGFDTAGQNLFMSATQIEQYQSLGREALEEAFALAAEAESEQSFRYQAEESNERMRRLADAAVATEQEHEADADSMRPYYEYLRGLPHQDEGAWLSPLGGVNTAMHLIVPPRWNGKSPADYLVRIRLARADDAPPERCVIEFGIDPPNGQILSTHKVTGSLEEPSVIEIPLTLTSEHQKIEGLQVFIREKDAADHTESQRLFAAAKQQNGIGPQAAIWVDWMEIVRLPLAATPAPAGFRVIANRQLAHVSAQGLRSFRFECEEVNDKVAEYVASQKDDRQRAERWADAVDAAAARPENAAIVAELKKASASQAVLRRSWAKIQGAPSPESFGFQTMENNADKANVALGPNWQQYHEYYLSRPALDRGAYLGVMTLHPSRIALDHLQCPVPSAWKSGDYLFRARVAATEDSLPEQRFLQVGMHPRNGQVQATFEVTGTLDNPQIIEMPFSLTRDIAGGDRMLWLREKGAWETNQEGGRKRSEAVKRNGIGPVLALWIDWMEIERVSEAAKPMPPALAALDLPASGGTEAYAAEDIKAALTRFATVAFRGREPSEGYIQRLAEVYDAYRTNGEDSTTALKDTLSIILASPQFLYLSEPAQGGESRQLTDLELATRLSYFLWSAPPDETLLDLAKSGKLSQPAILAGQTTRLLDDPRADEFVHGFLFQWLQMERFDFFEVNRPLYPRFDDSTRLSAKNEVYETFAYLVRQNAPVTDLLKADYVVVNRVLADYYGVPRPAGDGFEKVLLPEGSPRGGLLGMAATHFMGGNGERTNPVERGVWVLRKLLNDPPPPAPANVPQIERLAGKVLTTRERMLAHQEDPQCASCHRKIDPLGFGLENFDAVGQWRTEDAYQVKDENGKPIPGSRKEWTIDAGAAFYGGPSFKNYFELRDLIAAKSDDFAVGFSAALVEYALGRPLGFGDQPLLESMVETTRQKNFRTREFIHAVVQSEAFRSK
ncbi:DUF1592 domain-containing protein [Lignipirellula cremea]|nr:DUF1592 domain-containing protein [Lignipirellula cremea]